MCKSLILFYQIRCLLKQPLPVEAGAVVTGTVIFKANDRSATDYLLHHYLVEGSFVKTPISTVFES